MRQLTARQIADLCGAEVEGDASRLVGGLATLEDAGPDDVSFLAHPKYLRHLARTRAGVVLVAADTARPREDLVLLRCADPGKAFSKVVTAFAPPPVRPAAGVHPSAVVASSAELGRSVAVGATCVVGEGARIGDGAVLHAGVLVGEGATVGADTELHPGVVLYAGVSVGARCVLHAGAVIGADGFGFEPGAGGWTRVPQCGTVAIEDDVEIGACTTVDRGRFGPTRIGRGAKLDNLVHVGHNVVIGENCLLVAQVGVAGSAALRDWVVIGGQAGVGGHVEIGAGARVAGQSGVYGDLEGGREYLGSPARPRMEELRRMAASRKVGELLERLQVLERRLAELEAAERGSLR